MSTTIPVSAGVDPVVPVRGADEAIRAARGARSQPVILPPAVILPRTAAWLNPPAQPDPDAATDLAAASPATATPAATAATPVPVLQQLA